MTSLMLFYSSCHLYQLLSYVSRQDNDIFSGIATILVQPKITDVKMNIFMEILVIAGCVASLYWDKIKTFTWS